MVEMLYKYGGDVIYRRGDWSILSGDSGESRLSENRSKLRVGKIIANSQAELDGQTSGVMLNSRTETVLPKHGPTDGADSMPE
jgi:hypothetical protein